MLIGDALRKVSGHLTMDGSKSLDKLTPLQFIQFFVSYVHLWSESVTSRAATDQFTYGVSTMFPLAAADPSLICMTST